MVIKLLTIDLHFPGRSSLKEKRYVLSSLKTRLSQRYNVAIAEVGYQDKWQRSQWTFCAVGSDKTYVEGLLQRLVEFLDSGQHATLSDYQIEFL